MSGQNLNMRKIVIITWGSLGDVYPYVALAQGLRKRGYKVILASSPCHEQMIRSRGFEFRPVRPDCDWLSDPEKVRYYSHPRFGLLRVGRDWMGGLREAYEDTLAASEGADLIVTTMVSYASRLVAEKTGLPWVSAVHIPLGLLSSRDVPVLDIAPTLCKSLRRLGPPFWAPLFWLGKRASRHVGRPWYKLRKELGLPPTTEGNPVNDSYSPLLVLALFSKRLAEKQIDWPAQTVQTGFPFLEDDAELPASLEEFLDKGPAPLVFTLGSAVSMNAGTFYEDSIECARLLERRAVLVVPRGQQERFTSLPPELIAVEYAPFGKLFPRAEVIVHHGGVGTTALAMNAGRPMLVVPFAWDQPDHAARVKRLGIARSLSKHRYIAVRAAKEIQRLLDDPEYSKQAAEVARQMETENGVETACDAVEKLEIIGSRHSSANDIARHALSVN
jgi:rhamnosyltransferase subunit B